MPLPQSHGTFTHLGGDDRAGASLRRELAIPDLSLIKQAKLVPVWAIHLQSQGLAAYRGEALAKTAAAIISGARVGAGCAPSSLAGGETRGRGPPCRAAILLPQCDCVEVVEEGGDAAGV